MRSKKANFNLSKGKKPFGDSDSVKAVDEHEEKKDEETDSLLKPNVAQEGIVKSKKKKRGRRRVQWRDRNGNKLVEVLEFQPSESSDSEDELLDACLCAIM